MTSTTLPAAKLRHAAIYGRVSTADQDLARQERALRELHAREYPDLPAIEYREHGESAFKTPIFERPAGRDLCAAIEHGEIAVVLADAQDRLSRAGQLEWALFTDLCRRFDCAIHTVQDGPIRDDFGGEILGTVKALLARQESADKSHRSRAGKYEAARQGYWPHGIKPTGYDSQPDPTAGPKARCILIPNEDAFRLRRGFELVAEGASVHGTARALGFKPNTFSNLLRKRVYVGQIEYGDDVYEGKHEAIVPVETFERVQAILEANGHVSFRSSNKRQPFGPILRCGKCCSLLIATSANRPHLYYRCKKHCGLSVVAENLEAAVCAYLATTATWIEQNLASGGWRILVTSQAEAKRLAHELAAAGEEIARLVQVSGKGGRVGEEASRQLDALNLGHRALEEAHAQASRDAQTIEAELNRLCETLRFGSEDGWIGPDDNGSNAVVHFWRNADTETRRTTMQAILEYIFVDDDNIALAFRYGFPRAPITLPFANHRRNDPACNSAELRELGFGPREGLSPNGTIPLRWGGGWATWGLGDGPTGHVRASSPGSADRHLPADELWRRPGAPPRLPRD